jgi:hypothetical protein
MRKAVFVVMGILLLSMLLTGCSPTQKSIKETLNISSDTIPHPLITVTEDELLSLNMSPEKLESYLRDLYSVPIHTASNAWDGDSYATLWTEPLALAWTNRYAQTQHMTFAEKEAKIKSELNRANKKYIEVQIYLYSSVDKGYKYTELAGLTTLRQRVFIENDQGQRVSFAGIKVVNSQYKSYWDDSTLVGYWESANVVLFPTTDKNGVPIITKSTRWIKIWITTRYENAYFRFNFSNIDFKKLQK